MNAGTSEAEVGQKAVRLLKLSRKIEALTRNRQRKKDHSQQPLIDRLLEEKRELTQEITASALYKQLIALLLLVSQSLSMGYNDFHEDHRLLRPTHRSRRREESICITYNYWEE